MGLGLTKKLRFAQLLLFGGAPRVFAPRPSPISPELREIWNRVQGEFFPDRPDLRDYNLVWSRRRQKRVLASCSFQRRIVRVAREMKDPRAHPYLEPLLYHEMCHAVLGDSVGRRGKKRAWHGAEFRELERRHPDIAKLDYWIASGGWQALVRSLRARSAWDLRRRAS